MNSFIQTLGNPDRPVLTALPSVPGGSSIVAYGFKVFSNGMTMQYVGIAGDNESVKIVHSRAQQWLERTDAYQYEEVVTLGAYWTQIGMNEHDYYVSPYGGVTNNYEVYYLVNDGSSTRDWFAVHQVFAMEPGKQRYGSGWVNHVGYPKHDWSLCALGNPQLHDWDPLGSSTGSQTISISITGGTSGASATLGWSYTQPDVTSIDRSSTSTEIAQWEEQFNNAIVQGSTGGMEPGSSCGVNQPTYAGTYQLFDLVSKGTFKQWVCFLWIFCWWEYADLTSTLHLYVTYY